MTSGSGTGKPTPDSLGIDLSSLTWQSSGSVAGRGGAIEIARAGPHGEPDGQTWILMRVSGDPAGRILVYDRHEWECFLDGVRNGEFDVSG